MPKITTKRFYIAGELKEIEILYTSNKKFYAKGIPDHITKLMNKRSFETEDEIINAITSSINQYKNQIQTSKKVIRYNLHAAENHIYTKDKSGYGTHLKPKFPNVRIDRLNAEMGMTIDYEILYLQETGTEKKYFYIDDSGEMGYSANVTSYDTITDYSEEKVLLLESLFNKFDDLFKSFMLVMNDDKLFFQLLSNANFLNTSKIKLLDSEFLPVKKIVVERGKK